MTTQTPDVKALADAMTAIAQGYLTTGFDDRYIKVENPLFKDDDGSPPFLIIDVDALRAAPEASGAATSGDLKALAEKLEHHSLYVGLDGHTNNAVTSNLLAEASAALRAAASGAEPVAKTLEALSMWCTSERRKIRGRGGFDDQTEREIGIGLVEAELDRRAAALRKAASPPPADMRGTEGDYRAAGALRHAQAIAKLLWEKHWKGEAPNWKPASSLVEVLMQIDNATAGLTRATPPVTDTGIASPPAASADAVRVALNEWYQCRQDMNGMALLGKEKDESDEHRKAREEKWTRLGNAEHALMKAAALTAPVAGADASPSAMRERAAKIADPWPGAPLDASSTDIDRAVVAVRTEIAAAIRALLSQRPNTGGDR